MLGRSDIRWMRLFERRTKIKLFFLNLHGFSFSERGQRVAFGCAAWVDFTLCVQRDTSVAQCVSFGLRDLVGRV